VQLFGRLGLGRCLGGEIDPQKFTNSWQVSVNGEFVLDLNTSIGEGDQVLVFPHIAGG
jgi:molybdopterin converting factor small subunit